MTGEEVINFNLQMTNYETIIGWAPVCMKHRIKGRG